MVITVEQYKEIRHMQLEGVSQRNKRQGISRNTVKKYAEGEHVPWERKAYEARKVKVLTPEVRSSIKIKHILLTIINERVIIILILIDTTTVKNNHYLLFQTCLR